MCKIPSILLVDDDETTNFLHHRLLFRLNVSDQVLVASNGAQALAMLTQPNGPFSPANPVLVLLDLNMPVMNGFEFLEAFQALPSAQQQSAVVVVVTTSINVQDRERANSLPAAGFLTKPLTSDKITQVLEQHFG
ncbi:response regulator [Hymenobacter arizonensis]|uniref:Response regulator receiver domain-containing protein n=1 Tax=Hymenobacter arizonensis TaxID=1227077 RepID=A0A1I6BRE8_HYMAR|nr:response regulator [Hymenobacter arizonensis]SFQ83493.1 Response regulator receiver domain-containing protein [Hymenobacter arizonensis]